MRKATTVGITVLTISLLAGCGNNSNKKVTTSKKNSSSLVAKKKAASESSARENSKKVSSKKVSSESKAKARSESLAKAESESKASSASSSSTQSIANTAKNFSSTESEPTTLTEFVNKYGESPAAYKMDHDGMTEKQALAATPDNMETSGELQMEHLSKAVQESNSSSSSSESSKKTYTVTGAHGGDIQVDENGNYVSNK